MKKQDKISLLIFKKADNTITEKELKKLNQYLEKHPDFKEEYVLIENIFKELKSDNTAALPDNFKAKLREKLVDYNLNSPRSSKRRFLPVNTVASAVIAVFLVAFAVSYNSIAPLINEKNTTQHTENSSSRLRSITQDNSGKEDEAELKVRQGTGKAESEAPNETANTPVVINDAAEAEAIADVAKYSKEAENDYTLYNIEDINSKYVDSGRFVVISTDCSISMLKDISYEVLSEDVLLVLMKDYEKIKEITKNYNTEIKFSSQENLSKSEFILITKN